MSSAQDAVQPAGGRRDRLGLARAEIVSRAGDPDEIDPRVVRRDTLEDGERTELIVFALHDERRARRRCEGRLVAWTRALRWRDRMAEDDERIRPLALGEKGRDAPTKRAADESDALVSRRSELIAGGSEVLHLGRVLVAGPRATRGEGHR